MILLVCRVAGSDSGQELVQELADVLDLKVTAPRKLPIGQRGAPCCTDGSEFGVTRVEKGL